MINPATFPTQFPILTTERLLLRQPLLTDADDYFELMSNPNVTQYFDWDSYTHVDEATNLINILNQRFDDKTGVRWTIVLKDTGEVIGFAGFYSVQMSFTAGLGYGIKEKYWNKGLMQETLKTVIAYGVDDMDLNRVYAEVIPGNLGSERVLEKIGFQKEGLIRQSRFFKGKFNDMTLFSLLKEDIRQTATGSPN